MALPGSAPRSPDGDDRVADPLEPLLRLVAARDGAALRRLHDATAGRLLAVAMRVLDDRAAAEDVLQEVYLQVWHRATAIPDPCRQPLAWLTTLVRHRAIDVARRRRGELPLQWTGADGQEHQIEIPDDAPGPPERLAEAEHDARLAECLGRIDADPRHALMLAFHEGLTHFEVAARLARPLGTVKAWIRRSLLGLKACLDGEPATAARGPR